MSWDQHVCPPADQMSAAMSHKQEIPPPSSYCHVVLLWAVWKQSGLSRFFQRLFLCADCKMGEMCCYEGISTPLTSTPIFWASAALSDSFFTGDLSRSKEFVSSFRSLTLQLCVCVCVCLMVMWRAAAGRHSVGGQIKCVFGPAESLPSLVACLLPTPNFFVSPPLSRVCSLNISSLLSPCLSSSPRGFFSSPLSFALSFSSLSTPVVHFHFFLFSHQSFLLLCHFIYLSSLSALIQSHLFPCLPFLCPAPLCSPSTISNLPWHSSCW